MLAFGPFYHLTEAVDRAAAAEECHRVLAPGGVLMAVILPKVGSVAALIERAAATPGQVTVGTLRQVAETGMFGNASAEGFPTGFYTAPGAAMALFSEVGFEALSIVSVRSILYGREDAWDAIGRNDPALKRPAINLRHIRRP